MQEGGIGGSVKNLDPPGSTPTYQLCQSRDWDGLNPRHPNRPGALGLRENEKRHPSYCNQEGCLEKAEVWQGKKRRPQAW